jgi:O-antigen/teichoic acid export membrane protein
MFSLPLFLGSVATVFLTWTDTLTIGVLKDAAWSGIYNAALPLAGLILIIEKSFGGLTMPIITEMHVKGQTRKISRFYKDVTNWMFYAGLPFLLLLVLFSRNALHFVFGNEYVSGASALAILALGYFVSSIFSNAASVLFAFKKTRYLSMNSMVSAVLNVILNFMLIPAYGIAGAAVATVISLNMTTILAAVEVWKMTGMHPFTTRIFRSLLAGIISISFIYLLIETFWEFVPIPAIIALFFLFMGIYVLLLLALGTLQKSDVEILRAIENRFGIRISWVRKILLKFMRSS